VFTMMWGLLDSCKSSEDPLVNSGANFRIRDRKRPRLKILTTQKAVYLLAFLVSCVHGPLVFAVVPNC